jgi:hypothetical protein
MICTALGCILAAVFISISVAPGLAATFPDQLHLGSGALKAHSNVTFKELSLRTRPGGQDPTEGCVFVAELLHSRRAGWAIVLHHEGAGNHYYLGRGEEGDPPAEDSTMELLMEAAVRLLEDDLPPATEIAPGRRSVRAELNEGLVEALMTYPAPHSPVWVRMQDKQGHVRELHFRPDSVWELPVSEEEHLLALREQQAGVHETGAATAGGPEDATYRGVGLCRWAQLVSSSAVRSKRQTTEVIVINRRRKHHDGNGAAVAIGLGVGLGVGIPVVVLLALIPCVIALWLIRKRRRGSRTIRVADVPTGVFATGSPRDTTAHRQEAAVEEDVGPDYSSTRPVSPYQGSDLEYTPEGW